MVRRIKKPVEIHIPELEGVVYQEAWDKLKRGSSGYADAIEDAVENGYTPSEIYQYIMRLSLNPGIATLCRNAAAHQVRLQAG